MKTIFIGDIHGCYDELVSLLKKVCYVPLSDRLIILGDVINKGPKSKDVLELLSSLPCEIILGNHELAFIKYLDGDHQFKNHFKKLKVELGGSIASAEWASWMKSWPFYIQDDSFIALHAGLPPNTSIDNVDPEVITKIRTWGGSSSELNNPLNRPWFEFYKEEKKVIFGHWSAMGLVRRKNAIGIDTGCVWGGKLSAYILEEDKFVHVEAKRAYQRIKTES